MPLCNVRDAYENVRKYLELSFPAMSLAAIISRMKIAECIHAGP